MSDWYLYLLVNDTTCNTYLGVTNNPSRRIRQHNGEISGGAKYTHSHGKNWRFYLLVDNLTKSEALSYERICKNKRRHGKGKTPLERRLCIIYDVVGEDRCFLNK